MKFNKKFNVLNKLDYTDYGGFNEDQLKIPIMLYLSEIDDGALDQLYNLARLPFAFHHIAAMSDCHQGYGMPIGGVLATKDYIIPNAVGVDIGCGMCALRTSLFSGSLDKTILKNIISDIRKLIPVGFKHQKESQENNMPSINLKTVNFSISNNLIIDEQWESTKYQLGTLGGGNHFAEIQQGSDGYIWIMIHSGSRNLGLKVADNYNKIAVNLNEKYFSEVPKNWQLAFLPFHDEIGQMYFYEMNYCCDFALANRKLMMEKVKEAMLNHLDINFHDFINIHHNYAAMENHYGQNVLVHRKGATRAYEEELGIIPGSQGTSSYIVKGKGCKESFKSCSHGAGRLMSRTKARDNLNLQDEIKKLDDQKIIHSIRNKKDLDEASGAYKDIDEVMEHQKNLVSIKVKLKPLAVIKG